jgi:tRNA 2-thiouridine synthesizing protein B
MLHIVNKSPLEKSSLETCLRLARPGSVLLLIEDAVYAATAGNAAEAKLRAAAKTIKVCALAPDLEARGMRDKVIDGIELVDYGGFVDLVAEHKAVQSWL